MRLDEINLDRGDHLINPYPKGFVPVTIPEGRSGRWEVQRYEVDRRRVGLENLRLIRDGMARRIIPLGTYTRLVDWRGDSDGRPVTVMSDTPAEAHEHVQAFNRARGRCLINGLGLGFLLKAVLSKPSVEHVTVIEKSKHVIRLVAPTYAQERVKIVRADAFEYEPRGKYDMVWHDIWNDIDPENLPQMAKLRRKYERHAKWQGWWSREYLRKH